MARIDVTEQSIQGTWIDGYLQNRAEMKRLAQRYRELDAPEYGFSGASEIWTREDYFRSMAEALRFRFDHDRLPAGVRPVPCDMWLLQITKNADPRVKPIHAEYQADSRKEDYFHLITIHDECPIAEDCLQKVVSALKFEPKPIRTYVDPDQFQEAVREVLAEYVDLTAAPWNEVKRRLNELGENLLPIGY